jgi:GntR family transcriptional regulator
MTAELASGLWRAGDDLPAEAELAIHYKVGRRTVRKALAVLERQGLVVKNQGRRTLFRGRSISRLRDTVEDFPTAARRAGFVPSTRMVRSAQISAGLSEARALSVPLGAPVLEIWRLRLLDGRIAVCQRSVLPEEIASRIPLSQLERGSLYAALRGHAHVGELFVAAEQLTTSQASELEARYARIEPGRSVVRMIRVVADAPHRMVEYSNVIFLDPGYCYTAV